MTDAFTQSGSITLTATALAGECATYWTGDASDSLTVTVTDASPSG